MHLLQQRILKDGITGQNGVLKVDSFLNHQIDVVLLNDIGMEFKRLFGNLNISKILTIEASGIAIACITAQYFNVPVVFAKKSESLNLGTDNYESEVFSYTKNKKFLIRVSKKFISKNDNVLIIDDFLANGSAASGLCDIVRQASANVSGIGIVIEKGFQEGGVLLREHGYNVHSLAIVKSMENGTIEFDKDR